ncbi:unnamed protein product [Withania somnifera]
MAGVNKRKRGGKPKSDPPSTENIPSNLPHIDDVVFSVSNVELIDPPPSSTSHRPRRGRPRKIPNLPDNSNPETGKTLKVTSPNPTRRLIDKPNGNGVVSLISSEENAAVARVVPAMDAVVKVFCVHTEPNYSLPWQRKRQYSSSSSGFIIKGRRVLTNAHSVEHYTQVKLKKRGSDTKYLATVLAIGTECDIALLTVDGDEFWEGVSPVEFGDLPALQDAVTVVGYPIGGDTISVTSGVVSRIEILSYVHGSTELLGLQIDAAINSGNSGGPAFNDKGNCVGIAFQSLKHEDVENIGYVIPTPVIMHFIKDYEKNGSYTVPFRHGERIGFSYLVSQKYFGDIAAVKVLRRNSEILNFNIKLATQMRLIPAHNKGRPPSYYIIAGLVFTTVSVPYLRSEYGKDYEFEAPVKLLDKLLHEFRQSPDEQIVVVSQVLVADINIGYEEIVNTQVLSFNGEPIKNLKSLASMVVVLQTKTAKSATSDILATHCIPSAISEDLRM